MHTYIGDLMSDAKAQAGASALGSIKNAPVKPELGLIERTIGVVTGLQSLHARLGSFRDKIEGNGTRLEHPANGAMLSCRAWLCPQPFAECHHRTRTNPTRRRALGLLLASCRPRTANSAWS